LSVAVTAEAQTPAAAFCAKLLTATGATYFVTGAALRGVDR
jgi:hypothetical protein